MRRRRGRRRRRKGDRWIEREKDREEAEKQVRLEKKEEERKWGNCSYDYHCITVIQLHENYRNLRQVIVM